MCHGDKRRKVERPTRAVDPFRISRHRPSNHREVPGRAGDGCISREKLRVFLPEVSSEAWSCGIIVAGDVAAISKRQPAAYQSRPFAAREGARFHMQTKIGPRSEAIFACDAGPRIMQAEPKGRYFL